MDPRKIWKTTKAEEPLRGGDIGHPKTGPVLTIVPALGRGQAAGHFFGNATSSLRCQVHCVPRKLALRPHPAGSCAFLVLRTGAEGLEQLQDSALEPCNILGFQPCNQSVQQKKANILPLSLPFAKFTGRCSTFHHAVASRASCIKATVKPL